MRDRRRVLTDCYICGTPLPPRTRNQRPLTTAEHVIPVSLLGPPPPDSRDAWPVKLDVHAECEKRHKRSRDQMMKILQQLGSRGSAALSSTELGLARRYFAPRRERIADRTVAYVEGNEDVMDAPALWVRGLHAALYGVVLPEEFYFVCNPPVPMWVSEDGEAQEGVDSYRARRDGLLSILRQALEPGFFDELHAWGGRLVYQCTWGPALLGNGGRWGCVWALEFPGVAEWAATAGIDTPWHGYYESPTLPTGASMTKTWPRP